MPTLTVQQHTNTSAENVLNTNNMQSQMINVQWHYLSATWYYVHSAVLDFT